MKKVLIIDDEIDFCLLLKAYLTKLRYEVFYSNSLADGVEQARKINPAIIFLDNNLPDGLGWGETENILVNYPDTKLNLISAYHVPKTSSSSFRILEKPLQLEELNKLFQ